MDSVKNGNNFKGASLAAKYVVRVALMAAMLSALKFALSFIPNVEVVTLLILVYSAVFGAAYAIPAALVFCAAEVALYGLGSWVPLYFVYWTLLAFAGSALLKKRKLWVAVTLAFFMSVLFGVLSACSDTLFAAVNLSGAELSRYWIAYYLRGLYFDVVHVVSNAVVVGAAFCPLVRLLSRLDASSSRRAPEYIRRGANGEEN